MTEKKQKFDADLTRLMNQGWQLYFALLFEYHAEMYRKHLAEDNTKEEVAEIESDLPSFTHEYQQWYSEASALVRQVLPDRLKDFTSYYEYPRTRKEVSFQNYMVKDYLQGLEISQGSGINRRVVVDGSAAIPEFLQQLKIVEAAKVVLDSTLLDLRQILQADLFDSELDAARALTKAGFLRAAGVICGVVIEKHLGQVCKDRSISIGRKKSTINNLSDALKGGKIIETPIWRRIQSLADIRNVCSHNKDREPTRDEVEDLIAGTNQTIKTVF